jgi:hypothetical protein
LYGDVPLIAVMPVAVMPLLRISNHSGLRCGALTNSNRLLTLRLLSHIVVD